MLDLLRRKKTDGSNGYQEITEYVLENVDLSPEQADIISQKLGIQEQYASLLREREQGPYRTGYDLGELLTQAWHEKQSRALVRKEETSLERKVDSALVPAKNGLSALDYLGAVAKVYGGGFYSVSAKIVKGTSLVLKEVATTVLYSLLPGRIQGWLDERTAEVGVKRT